MRRCNRLGALAAGLLGATFFASGTTAGVDATSANPTAVVPLGTRFNGLCELVGGQIDGRISYWEVDGVIPAFRRGATGVVLAPPAEELPRPGKLEPAEPFRGAWVLEPRLMASPVDRTCDDVRTFDPLQAKTMEQPGPHVFVQYNQTVSFVRVESTEAPTPQPCAANDPDFPDPSSEIPPPPDVDDDKVWSVATFCNRTDVRGLNVTTTMRCSGRGDMSRWPGMPYINQYDAGARLGLPSRFGYRGGNASGPSALLMAMLRSAGPRDLPTLRSVYNVTMQRPNFANRPNEPNEFVARRAVALLRSLGWRSARVRSLPTNVVRIELRILESLAKGPVVVSTGFGNERWGTTGVGNLIVIVGADPRGRFIVQDPAGNYFASPRGGYLRRGGHYGPGSCGHRVPYPHYWLLAYTTGRYLIELGRRTRP